MKVVYHLRKFGVYTFALIFIFGCSSRHSPINNTQPPAESTLVNDFEPCSGAPHGQTTTPSACRAMMAWSTNGRDFKRPANPMQGRLIDRIGVPDAVLLPSGRIMVYFVTGCRIYNGLPQASNDIAVAVSDHQAEAGSWVYKEVHFVGIPPGDGVPFDPNVVLLPDGRVSMLATLFVNEGGKTQMGATAFISNDGGFTFTFQGLRYAGVIDPENYRFSDTDWQIITGEPGEVKGYAISTDGGNTFQPFGSFPDHLVVHEIAVTDRLGEYRAYTPTENGIRSSISITSPWTDWSLEPGYCLQLDTSSGLESCHVTFPTVLKLAPLRYLMIYETVIPGCGCGNDPVCE